MPAFTSHSEFTILVSKSFISYRSVQQDFRALSRSNDHSLSMLEDLSMPPLITVVILEFLTAIWISCLRKDDSLWLSTNVGPEGLANSDMTWAPAEMGETRSLSYTLTLRNLKCGRETSFVSTHRPNNQKLEFVKCVCACACVYACIHVPACGRGGGAARARRVGKGSRQEEREWRWRCVQSRIPLVPWTPRGATPMQGCRRSSWAQLGVVPKTTNQKLCKLVPLPSAPPAISWAPARHCKLLAQITGGGAEV